MTSQESYTKFLSNGRRSVVFSTKGIAASSQALASEIGLSILRAGGNCADACVAMAAALNVTEPCNTGIGGDVFGLFYDAKEKRVRAINGSGRSPKELSLEKARAMGINGIRIPNANPNSVTVPGASAAWVDIHEHFGSGMVTMAQVLQPAIQLAEEGFVVSERCAAEWADSLEILKTASPNGGAFLLDGRTPRAGEVFSNPDLANTFKKVAAEGKAGFYKGEVAQAIVDVIQSLGGLMTMEDLAAHESELVEPISYTYGIEQLTVHECPPNGSGLAALIALGILDVLREDGIVDLSTYEEGSAEWLHALIEAIRLAFADVRAYVADPQVIPVPTKELLSKEYLRKRAKLFSLDKAEAQYYPGQLMPSSDTVYFTAADSEGNAMSMINSNFLGFGSGIVPAKCGFSLQNRGSGFLLGEGPNKLAGGKRPFHTIIPAMVTRGDELFMSFGVMGGNMQPQGHVQVLTNLLHHGHHAQGALDVPRFCIGGIHSNPTEKPAVPFYNDVVSFEEGTKPEVLEKLAKMGHKVEIISGHDRLLFGKGQIILRAKDSRTGRPYWIGGSDPRGDGAALPQV